MRAIVPLLAISFAGLLGTLATLRWSYCHNATFDLALYARTAWGLAHGDAWNPIADASFVHLHAAWILIPLGLLARWLGAVPVLLVAQSLAVGACLWPLARVGRRHLGEAGVWIAAALWLTYPNLGHVASYEMHPGTLALLPLCWGLDALDRNHGRHLLWSTLGVIACRADHALITAMMGALLWWSSRSSTAAPTQVRQAGTVVAVSLLYLATVLVLQRLWPMTGPRSADLHFGVWGGSPLGVVRALVTEPRVVLSHFADHDRLTYLARVIVPLAFVPLLAARWLWLAAPVLALNLISAWPTATRLDSHYLTPAVPVLIVAALIGAARIRERTPWLHAVLPAASLVASVIAGGLPWSRDFPSHAFTSDAQSDACRTLVARIPRRASVQAPDRLLPQLAERSRVHRGPPPERGTEYVVLDAAHRRRFAHQGTLLRTTEEPQLRTWLARSDHTVVHVAGDLLLLERGGSPRAGQARRYFIDRPRGPLSAERRLTECLSIGRAWLASDDLRLELVAHGACPPDLAIRFGAEPRPQRVDLLFDGVLNPAHLRADDQLISSHGLDRTEAAKIRARGLFLGALRSSGARPQPGDPLWLKIPVETAP